MNFTELDIAIRDSFLVYDWITLSHSEKLSDSEEFETIDFREHSDKVRNAELSMNKSSARPVAEHTHRSAELMYVYEGSIIHSIGGQKEQISKGGFILFSPGSAHSIDEAPDSIALNIRISKQYWNINDIRLMKGNYLFENVFLTQQPVPYFVVPTVSEQCEINIKSILCEFLDPDMSSISAIKGSLTALFSMLFRSWKESGGKAPLRSQFAFSDFWEIIRYIELNFRTATLKEAGVRFGYNPAYISRLIRKKTGQSFLEIKQRMAIDYTKNLLVSSDLPVSDIIERSGFSNINHFYSTFNKYCGVTPSEYRKNNK